jgi:hypothetical protein
MKTAFLASLAGQLHALTVDTEPAADAPAGFQYLGTVDGSRAGFSGDPAMFADRNGQTLTASDDGAGHFTLRTGDDSVLATMQIITDEAESQPEPVNVRPDVESALATARMVVSQLEAVLTRLPQ